jgi:riboflavin synthase
MFTGIVTAQGRLAALAGDGQRLELTIEAPFGDLEVGESVAVQGACLTVTRIETGSFTVQAVVTTRERTTIADWRVGDTVNLERPLAVGDRFGGHLVQGHVDGVGEVVAVRDHDDARLVDIRVTSEIDLSCVIHGSIAVDGVSLTISEMPAAGVVQVALIPYTRAHTTLGSLRVGSRVHLEGDLIGKYVAKLIEARGG